MREGTKENGTAHLAGKPDNQRPAARPKNTTSGSINSVEDLGETVLDTICDLRSHRISVKEARGVFHGAESFATLSKNADDCDALINRINTAKSIREKQQEREELSARMRDIQSRMNQLDTEE